MTTYTYLALVHLGNPTNALTMNIQSYSKMNEKEIQEFLISKLKIESRLLKQPTTHKFKVPKD